MSRTSKLWLLALPIAIWLTSLIIFSIVSRTAEPLPPVASEGLNDVWYFYLPLALLTLAIVFFFTRKRERPSWEHFAVNRKTVKRDLFLALGYLVTCHLLLGSWFNTALHFPGPDVYASGSHGLADIARWAIIQGLVFSVLPYLWLRRQGFSMRKLIRQIQWKRDIWIMLAFWASEFASVVMISDFLTLTPIEYTYAIPFGVLVNTIGAGLPVLIIIHLIVIPRLSILLNNQLLVIMIAGLVYAVFSLFDPGVSYLNSSAALASVSYIVATQTLIGMGKATFTVRTGNPFIHFTSFHILGARVAFDTAMFAQILRR